MSQEVTRRRALFLSKKLLTPTGNIIRWHISFFVFTLVWCALRVCCVGWRSDITPVEKKNPKPLNRKNVSDYNSRYLTTSLHPMSIISLASQWFLGLSFISFQPLFLDHYKIFTTPPVYGYVRVIDYSSNSMIHCGIHRNPTIPGI